MRIRHWIIPFIFLLLCSALEWSFASSGNLYSCESPLLTHVDQSNEREFSNIYQCMSALNAHNVTIATATVNSVTVSTLTFSDGTKMTTAASGSSSTGRLVQSSCTFRNDQTLTTSASFGDVTGMTITLTPLSSASTLYINVAGNLFINGSTVGDLQLFNGSNVSIVPGSVDNVFGEGNASVAVSMPVGFEMPYNYNSVSSLTVKLRMKSSDGVHNVLWNHNNTAEAVMCVKEFQ